MLLLLNVLRNANTSEYRKLRAKAMECAGLIGNVIFCQPSACCSCASPAIAVRRKVFRVDAGAFVEILIRIQSMFFMLSRVTRVSVCRHQMASCKQSSVSERYDALTLPDCNMGKNLRVRAVPAGCDATSILCHKHDSGRVGLWFVTANFLGGPVGDSGCAEDDEDVPESEEGWETGTGACPSSLRHTGTRTAPRHAISDCKAM